jgi:hypothetical protein
MDSVDSQHLGVIEQVSGVAIYPYVAEMAVMHANPCLNPAKKYILYLKADTTDVPTGQGFQGVGLPHITATESVKLKNALIITVSLPRRTYTLICKKNKISSLNHVTITSEVEQEANALISISKKSEIKNLFAEIHGHGRLWGVASSDIEDESWEVLLLDKLLYFKEDGNPTSIEQILPVMAPAFNILARLHERHYAHGHPTLNCLAFKDIHTLPWPQIEKTMVWTDSRFLREITSKNPLTIHIAKLKDITMLLLNNDFVLRELGLTDFTRIDLDVFRDFHLQLSATDTLPQFIMPHEILKMEINDDNVINRASPLLPQPSFTFWMVARFRELADLENALSKESNLNILFQDMIGHYKKIKLPQHTAPLIPTPPSNTLPQRVPVVPRPPPVPLPVNTAPMSAEIGRPYLLQIDNTNLGVPGNQGMFYKYKRLSPEKHIIGIGTLDPNDFRQYIIPQNSVYFTSNTVILTFPRGTIQPQRAQISFHFLPGNSFVIQLMAGTHIHKRYNLSYYPPMETH